MIVLDTSVLSLAFRRRRRVSVTEPAAAGELRRLVEVDEPLGVPGLVLQELLSGVRTRVQFEALDALMRPFPLLLARRSTHVLAAEVAGRCRSAGIATTSPDCLVAAHALEVGGQVFTTDRDFEHMAPLCAFELHPW